MDSLYPESRSLADRGSSQSIGATISAPGSDLEFYRLTYQGEKYFP